MYLALSTKVVEMPDLVPVALLGAFVFTLVNFLKFVTSGAWNAAVTQVTAWVAGLVSVFVFAQTAWAESVEVLGVAVANANSWELAVLGLMATSLFSVAYDFKKAFDNADSAETPHLTNLQ